MKELNHPKERWVLIGVLFVFVLVAGAVGWSFWRQLDRLHELRMAEQELVPLVNSAEARNRELRETLARVSSPDYAEEWARTQAGMTRMGEVRVVVNLPEEPATAAAPQGQETLSLWQQIWLWLTGEH
jgi:cell division protein FtsB